MSTDDEMRHPLSAFLLVLISGSHSFPLFPQKRRPRIVVSITTTSHARKIPVLAAARSPPPPPFLLLAASSSSSSSSAQESGHDDDNNNNADDASIIRKKLPLLNLTSMSMARPLTDAVGASTSFVVSAVFFAVLAWQRDALMVSFFIGAISNGILSKVLKKIINQTRPAELETADLRLKPSDGGMPSSHAMSLGFISTFTALQLPWTRVWLVLYVVLSLVYRVQVNLHTWQQIAVGSIVGSCNGYAWFRLCTGDNPWNVRVLDVVAVHFLDESGRLPLPMLLVPVLLGAAIVGSFERRIGAWLKKQKKEGKREE